MTTITIDSDVFAQHIHSLIVAMQHSEYYAAQASYNDGLISSLSNYIRESTE